MKKILSMITAVMLIMSLCITASAAGTATVNANGSVTVGGSIEFTVSVSGCGNASSIAVSVSYGDGFELVSGNWLKTGSINKFDTATNKGALGGLSSPDVNGNIFKLVLKAKTASANAQSVSVNVIAKNGSNEILNVTPSKSVKINCSAHNYGECTRVDNNKHKRVCTVCGHEETTAHTWNGGTVTKHATCKESGTKHFTCTACNATKDETIAKTNNHSWGNWNTTKQAGCTTPGTTTKTCSVCGKTETQQINATGHSMGAWTQSKAPTCTAAGEEKRSCSKCGHSETRALKALGHSFSHPTVTKEPTCTETGIETGKCSRCGQTTSNTIKAKGHKFGAWADTKPATCTEGGTKERKCSACGAAETKATEALGHDFENPTIVKAATISETGLKEGKCRRCGETTSEVIPCSAQDEATGTLFEANEGVFAAGTQLTVEEIKTDNPTFDSAKNILKDVSGEFKLYNIAATLGGAETAPNGEVKARFNIPDGYGKDIALYLIKTDGTSEKVDCEISDDGKTLSAKLTALGDYAICKLGGGETSTDTEDGAALEKPEKNSTAVYIIIAVCAAVLIGGGIAFMVIKKKRIR